MQRTRYDFEMEWPEDVWCIGIDRMDLLGVDGSGQLYWDGKRIEVEKPLSLTRWQKVGAIIVTISAVIGSLAAVASAAADWLKP